MCSSANIRQPVREQPDTGYRKSLPGSFSDGSGYGSAASKVVVFSVFSSFMGLWWSFWWASWKHAGISVGDMVSWMAQVPAFWAVS